LAKEHYKGLERELFLISLYSTSVSLLDSSESKLLREGTADIDSIEEKLQDITACKSLIAWLREAISAKTRLTNEAAASSYNDYGLEVPEQPTREEYLSEDDVIATWNIKQRNRYYYLEALCATIGGYIHPGNPFANARDEFLKILSQPNELKGNGRDTLLYTYTPSVEPNKLEEVFMHLQQVYRSYQAELNSLKHSIEDALNKDKAEKNLKYETEMREFRNSMALIDAQLKEKVHEATVAAQNLKIAIPDSLRPIYDKIQKLGK
jgi:hypothetical protein